MAVRVQKAAVARLDDIFRYTLKRWGRAQAEDYIAGLFQTFDGIETGRIRSRPIPAEFGVTGFFYRYGRHFVYWKYLGNGDIGIATVLHERMHLIDRFKADFFDPS